MSYLKKKFAVIMCALGCMFCASTAFAADTATKDEQCFQKD